MTDLNTLITPEVEARVKWRKQGADVENHDGEVIVPGPHGDWAVIPCGSLYPDWSAAALGHTPLEPRWAPLTEVMKAYAAARLAKAADICEAKRIEAYERGWSGSTEVGCEIARDLLRDMADGPRHPEPLSKPEPTDDPL